MAAPSLQSLSALTCTLLSSGQVFSLLQCLCTFCSCTLSTMSFKG